MQDVPEPERVRILSPVQRARAAAAARPPVPLSRRIAAGLPSALADLLTAAVCLATWIAPGSMPADFVRVVALVMLIEFLSIHGAVLLPLIAFALPQPLGVLRWLLAMLFYLGFAAAASLALGTWWPTVFFAWLLVSRYLLPRWNLGGHDEHIDMGALWLVSLLLWMVLVFATVMMPVPEFGWDSVGAGYRPLGGSGIWAKDPERLLAFATLYFLGLAAFKLGARPRAGAAGIASRPQKL